MYIDLKDIHFKYEKEHPILTDLSFGLEKGEVAAIIGNSGSGKSTLLRIIAGLEKAIKGEMKIDSEIIFSNQYFLEPNKRNIGMVFQDYALFPHLTVSKNITFSLFKQSKKYREEMLNKMLDLISLKDKKTYYPHELSGGQQQRVALARSIAQHPKLLLMDEPFSNLDANLKKQIRNDLKDILKKCQMTCIFATHDLEDARDIADRILYLEEGKITSIEVIHKF